MMQMLFATLVTLGLLITFHEFGHFWVARKCGVKVLRFSIGFGKPLIQWTDKQGTEYAIAMIPLGGYVKMLDERESEVSSSELDQAFNRKPVLQRIAVVAAGPIANFLLAIVLYSLVFGLGSTVVKPVIGEVPVESIAAKAGLKAGQVITRVDGKSVQDWTQVQLALVRRIGESGVLTITATQGEGWTTEHTLTLDRWQEGVKDPDPFGSLGIHPKRLAVPAVIDQVLENSAALKAGLQSGDLIKSIDGSLIGDWRELVEIVKSSPGKALVLDVDRNGQLISITLTPDAKDGDKGKIIGFMGVMPKAVSWPEEYLVEVEYGVFGALLKGMQKTWDMSVLTLESIWKMLGGLISIENISGPITIAKVAGDSVSYGLVPFLSFLAYVSVSLGVLNMLPIPVLDGGHLVYYLIELARGKPLSQSVQELGLRLGVALIGSLMIFAVFNDISRWFIGS
ncbi:sigma E protease regulator RseP [Litoribrevibacter albus]|uniref:Zinc metalloprotease n=1 Tax=Litoribrevibacter albus TaxID=1473156 RepID=A0AA37SAK1_9GAMM|nr:sigma E protease regulator RseP [Litoribrevibacter albus]GLQ31172.1 putative zinc metalloprotease [Litoribrevibacter albus]